MNRVLDKVIIVTGGATGIGQAACYLLAREGASIALLDINDQSGRETVKNIQRRGGQAEFWRMDVTHEPSVQQVFSAVVDKFGRIDGLVNNAGVIGSNQPTHEVTEGEWDQVMNVNVKGTLFCTKHVIPYLKKAGGGSIINISSIHGLLGSPDYPANHAAKGAIRSMSKTDAMLYAKDKIRVNSIHPGYIQTACLGEVPANLSKLQPLGHVGEANDIAYGILYLVSDESKFVTASELVIDGGIYGGRIFD
jgi:NAD(P)-dependent dehydrogenase (short-subunit alcohol dehydrogenase family)